MLKKFSGDLRRAKVGEAIVMQVLQSVYGNDYDFNDVSDNKEYWHTTCTFSGTSSVHLSAVGVNAALTYILSVKPDSEMEWE